jgi:hypothetical protein
MTTEPIKNECETCVRGDCKNCWVKTQQNHQANIMEMMGKYRRAGELPVLKI